jgi:hypothetical protein
MEYVYCVSTSAWLTVKHLNAVNSSVAQNHLGRCPLLLNSNITMTRFLNVVFIRLLSGKLWKFRAARGSYQVHCSFSALL